MYLQEGKDTNMKGKVYSKLGLNASGKLSILSQWQFTSICKGDVNYLIVKKGGTAKGVPLVQNAVYVYLLKDFQIHTNKAPEEFVEYLDNALTTRRDEQSAWRILEYAFDNGKPVRIKKKNGDKL